MGISWLWHFTRFDDKEGLREQNEYRAAMFYSRWRALHSSFEDFIGFVRNTLRERDGQAELDALSDYLLRDVGQQRGSDGAVFPLLSDPRCAGISYRCSQHSCESNSEAGKHRQPSRSVCSNRRASELQRDTEVSSISDQPMTIPDESTLRPNDTADEFEQNLSRRNRRCADPVINDTSPTQVRSQRQSRSIPCPATLPLRLHRQ